MGKEEFKTFVKKNPKLVKYIKDGSSSWQKFYEIYDMYGEDENVWKEYLGVGVTSAGIGEVVNIFKNINLDSLQNGVNNIQRVLGVIGDLTNKDTTTKKEEYKPRPIYKHFED